MNNKSKGKIKIYQNKAIKLNKNTSKNITYNKPLFISMKNEYKTNNNTYRLIQKTSSISTKICSTIESPNTGRLGNNNMNKIHSVKDFEIDKNYSKTSANFFTKYINTSISSNDDYNNNYETFTPSRKKEYPFIEEDKEQFTPYLGQKKSNEKNSKENKKNSLNKKNYSFIFNNSREMIESTSLNLKDHFDEELSKKYKIINKFQKLSFYQKKSGLNKKSKSRNKNNKTNTNYSSFLSLNGNSKSLKKQILYKKKSDLSFQRERERKTLEWFYIHNIDIAEREFYERYAIIIQTIFRGYISRIKLYNKLKLFTCISVFCQIINNIYFENNKYILKYCFKKMKKYNINSIGIYRNSFIIEGDENRSKILCNEIKELIDQNNKLQIKLNEFLINNNILKNDIINYKEFEFKYNKLLIQLEKLQNANNNILKENNRLIKELNIMKNNYIQKSDLFEPQKIVNIIIDPINDYKRFDNIEICKNINNINIKDIIKPNINSELEICSNINNLEIYKCDDSFDKFKNLKICENLNQIEIIENKNIHKFKELLIMKNINNISIYKDFNNILKKKIFQIEKQNNFYFSQIYNNIKLKQIKNIIEKKENFSIKNTPIIKITKDLIKENTIFFTYNKINNIQENETKDENLENILSDKNQLLSLTYSLSNDAENKSIENILKYEGGLSSNKKDKKDISDKNDLSDKKEISEKNDNIMQILNNRNSLRITLRNKKIESQEVNLELGESNLSKEEILKRKRLRNLFKNKLFLLRDITRKYFLRFYYNGIYIKMVGKKPKPLEKLDRIQSEDIKRKRGNTLFIEKGQYLRKVMQQKAKEKKETIKKYFYLYKSHIDIENIRKKLIENRKKINEEKIIKRNNILISFINKINNGNFSYSNIKRILILWKNKVNSKNEVGENDNDNHNIIEKENSEIDSDDEENEEEEEENSLEYYVKNVLKRNFKFDNDDNNN